MAKPLAVVPDLDLELDNIYALPPVQFTSARNDLARRLKQAGRDDAAAEVKQLRKPTVPVWAVNQLARTNPGELAALVQASEQLREAQRAALSGSETQQLRRATAAQRDALQTLTHRAHELLAAGGHSPTAAVIERIASTLRAAAVDPSNRKLLEAGRVNEELDASGFDAYAGMPLPKPRQNTAVAKRAKKPDDRRRKERLRKLREQSRKAEAAARSAEKQASEAEGRATAAREEAERALAELETFESSSD